MHTIRNHIATAIELLTLAENAVIEVKRPLRLHITCDEIDAWQFSLYLHRHALESLSLGGQADRRRIAGLRSHRDPLERAMRSCFTAASLLDSILAEKDCSVDLHYVINGVKFGVEVLANELEAHLPPSGTIPPARYTIALN